MRLAEPRVKLTYDDFLLFPDDGLRHELIDGVHYVTPSPRSRHQIISGNLHYLVRTWLETHPAGRILYAPDDVVFSNFDIVVPDLIYVSNERWDRIITEKHAVGAPDLVARDRIPRARANEMKPSSVGSTSGPASRNTGLWIPQSTSGRVYRRLGEGFGKPFELSTEAADLLTTSLLPGLALPLSRIFDDK